MVKRIILVLVIISVIICCTRLNTLDESKYLMRTWETYTATIVYDKQGKKKTQGITIDTSSCNDGYIIVKYTGNSVEDTMVDITYNGENRNMYRVGKNCGKYVFNLAYGNGSYKIEILQLTDLSVLASKEIVVANMDEFNPFLISTYAIKYNEKSMVIQEGRRVIKGCLDNFDKLSKIYNFVLDNIEYGEDEDEYYGQWTYFTDIDKIYSLKRGVCTDYTTMFAALCRSFGIPCKVITGYSSSRDVYHTWVEVYVEGKNIEYINENAIRPNEWSKIDLVYDDAITGKGAGIVLQEVYKLTNID
jgi:hypothetical protein